MRALSFLLLLIASPPCLPQVNAPGLECGTPARQPDPTQTRSATLPSRHDVLVQCGTNTITQSFSGTPTSAPEKTVASEAQAKLTDFFVLAGVGLTFLLGLINLYFTLRTGKRTAFINTVTSERVKWIDNVRKNVSSLCSLCDQWVRHRTQDSTPELQRQIEQLKNEVRLQLNPSDKEDKEIARLLDRLPNFNQTIAIEDYGSLQMELVAATQAMLKREWDKVKEESIHGDLRETKRRW